MTSIGAEFVLVHVDVDDGDHGDHHSGKTKGDSIFMDVNLDKTTISDCARWISQQVQAPKYSFTTATFLLGDYGPKTYRAYHNTEEFSSDVIEDDNHVDYLNNYLCRDRPIVVHFHAALHPFKLYIRTLMGKVIPLSIMHRAAKMKHVKEAIYLSEKIPPDQQRLIFEGKQLEDHRTLQDYSISSGSTLHMILRLRGGGGPPVVDVTRSIALRTFAWNKDAPRWRVVEPGLCLEGICRNPSCCAYRRMVIANMNIRKVDLAKSIEISCLCPVCHQRFQPIKPGFNNCFWKISAVKESFPESVFHTPWKRAEDAYTTYNEVTAGMSVFTRLQIFVRPLSMKSDDTGLAIPRISPVVCPI